MSEFRENLIDSGIDINKKDFSEISDIIKFFINKIEKDYLNARMETKTIHHIDELSSNGDDFENLIVRLYEAMGYASKRIGRHGDQGGDVIASKDGENILIQAKNYQGTVGNAAVQHANAAMPHYGCNKAIVITTSSFTKEAIELAKSNSVELIDGKLLKHLLATNLKENWF